MHGDSNACTSGSDLRDLAVSSTPCRKSSPSPRDEEKLDARADWSDEGGGEEYIDGYIDEVYRADKSAISAHRTL